MPFGKFTLYTFLGVIPWTYALTWAGVVVEDNWERVAHLFDLPAYLIAATLVVGVVVWYVRRRKRLEMRRAVSTDRSDEAESEEPKARV
jgi:membrane protein DedA with SNARE-associated domain